MIEWVYRDESICVCIKPSGVLSTDEPGGIPDLVRQALGDPNACIRTVHRLDRVVSGLMVLARSPESASALSAQIRARTFTKTYLAVVHGIPEVPNGTLTDLLFRDRSKRQTIVVQQMGKGVQEAVLDYEQLASCMDLSLLRIHLRTGRTHQIRVQFACRALPLVGEKKYSVRNDPCNIALFSNNLSFFHPQTGQRMDFSALPPEIFPWNLFPATAYTK